MEEMRALEKNKTWELYTLPKGHKSVGCKWVFTIKYRADGTLDRYKARLVAKGFTQTYGVVARSSAETEYRAMSLGICEEIWLQKVLFDLHQEYEMPIKLFCDNKVAISIANQHDRTKHVEIDRHFIKEKLDSGSICIPYIPSSQ